MRVLITGGAGYIGSVITRILDVRGYTCAVLDNLETGYPERIKDYRFYKADTRNRQAVHRVFGNFSPTTVIHLAAYSNVYDSILDPDAYYQNNVVGSLNILSASVNSNTKISIFCSTCAMYGHPDHLPITEETPQRPINPYGQTKLTVEKALLSYQNTYGIKTCSLRYFNVSGATFDYRIGNRSRSKNTRLIPAIFQSHLSNTSLKLYGNDYEDPDGTCVRDHIHVVDLARSHFHILENLNKTVKTAYNIGTGRGYSNLEVVQAAKT